jgi:RNA-directed DNA polymerase
VPRLAEGTGTLAGATAHRYRRGAVRRRRPRSAGRADDTRHLTGAPCPPSSLASRDINIVLLTAQIKHGPRPPSRDDAFELEVTFCVRGVLSPLLSNIVLHALNSELERRGHRFVRYADDCNVYVRSARAGQRVMASIVLFITTRLKLKVNTLKSAVALARERTFLGFSFTHGQRPKRRLAEKTLVRFRARVRMLTRRVRGVSLRHMASLRPTYWDGGRTLAFARRRRFSDAWTSEFDGGSEPVVWKQWTRPSTRFRELRKRGVNGKDAILTARSNRGPWRVTLTKALCWAPPGAFFDSLGLPYLEPS